MMETFAKSMLRSLRGAKRRGNLIGFVSKARLLRCARNDNFRILQKSRMEERVIEIFSKG